MRQSSRRQQLSPWRGAAPGDSQSIPGVSVVFIWPIMSKYDDIHRTGSTLCTPVLSKED